MKTQTLAHQGLPTAQPPDTPSPGLEQGGSRKLCRVSVAGPRMAPGTPGSAGVEPGHLPQPARPLPLPGQTQLGGAAPGPSQRPQPPPAVPWAPGSLPVSQEPASLGSPCSSQPKADTPAQDPALPSAAPTPSVPPAAKWGKYVPGPRGLRAEERTGSEGTRSRELGLLSTERAQNSSGFSGAWGPDSRPGLPPWAVRFPWSGRVAPCPRPLKTLLGQRPPPSSLKGGNAPISLEMRSQPKGRGHAVQPGKAVTHSIPLPPARFSCHTGL